VNKNKLFAQGTYLRALSVPGLHNCSLTEIMPRLMRLVDEVRRL